MHNDSFDLSCSGDLNPKVSFYYQDALEHSAPAPEFTGISGKTRGPVEISFQATGIFRERIWKRNDRNFWKLVSENLPSWGFIYVAPDTRKSLPPLVLNKGNPLLFVSPKPISMSAN